MDPGLTLAAPLTDMGMNKIPHLYTQCILCSSREIGFHKTNKGLRVEFHVLYFGYQYQVIYLVKSFLKIRVDGINLHTSVKIL